MDLFPPEINVSMLVNKTHSKHTHFQFIMTRLFVKLESSLFALHNFVSAWEAYVPHTRMGLP